MATFVIVHGAWGGAWSWNKYVVPLLRQAGHTVHPVTLTGLGDRTHLSSPEVTLDTHIRDVVNVLFYEDLSDVILVGHSYGGMVATGVADRASERIRKVVYLDAFVPKDGQCLNDLTRRPPEAAPGAPTGGPPPAEGWLVPPMPPSRDASPDDLAWVNARRGPHPAKTMSDPVHLTGAVDGLP